jgi:FkbM family methyltransferase
MMQQSAAEREANGEFRSKLFSGLLRDCYTFQEHNTDFLRFGVGSVGRLKRKAKDKVLAFLSGKGLARRPFDLTTVSERLVSTLDQIDGLERTYHLLQDNHSRQVLLDLLRFRILGARHVRLPRNEEQFWAEYNSVDARFLKERRTIADAWRDWSLNLYELPEGSGGPLKIHANVLGILQTFLLEQYAYRRAGRCIRAKEGDVAIDGGGCWGDTALYFAAKVGASGKVYCFEFEPSNLDILQQNLALNPHLAGIVEVVPNALWAKSGEVISYVSNGPATSMAVQQPEGQQPTSQASTLSIDDLVGREALAKVDFIKMDIESAELKALKGAEGTLRAFKPTLAISLYHRDDDFVTIPDYLDKLGQGYEFFLDHFTIHREETVLFARPKP